MNAFGLMPSGSLGRVDSPDIRLQSHSRDLADVPRRTLRQIVDVQPVELRGHRSLNQFRRRRLKLWCGRLACITAREPRTPQLLRDPTRGSIRQRSLHSDDRVEVDQ